MRSKAVVVALGWLPSAAWAGSIASPGIIGAPDSSPVTVNPAAAYYNPAALAPTEGFDAMLDLHTAAISVEATTTRNGGLDPNTGEAYGPANASVIVPVGVIGAAYNVVPDRLTVGFSVTQPFTGGGDYTQNESPDAPPYTGHQRYAGIKTRIITIQSTLAVAGTPIDGVHVGAGGSYVYDSISALQASDPFGTEGRPIGCTVGDEGCDPYSADSILEASASGGHFVWNAGIFIDKIEQFQVGASYSSRGNFNADGEGSIRLPAFLQNESYPGDGGIPAQVTFDMPLPAVGRVFAASQLNEQIRVGAGWEYYYWYDCCGTRDGDLVIGLTDMNGEGIGADDGSSSDVASTQYSPRRVWSHVNVHVLGEFAPNDKLWFGLRLAYHQYGVPDYAVSATNLDFTNVGGALGAR